MLVFLSFGKGWESTAERQKIEKNKERSAPPWQPEIAKKQQRAQGSVSKEKGFQSCMAVCLFFASETSHFMQRHKIKDNQAKLSCSSGLKVWSFGRELPPTTSEITSSLKEAPGAISLDKRELIACQK